MQSDDPIEAALNHIQERCRLSWSENEIIALVENVRLMRRQEKGQTVVLPVYDSERINPGPRELWG